MVTTSENLAIKLFISVVLPLPVPPAMPMTRMLFSIHVASVPVFFPQKLPAKGNQPLITGAVLYLYAAPLLRRCQQAPLFQPPPGLPGGAFSPVQQGDSFSQHPGNGLC